jgi:hypothetical protein
MQFGAAISITGNIGKNRQAILKAWEENCDSERKTKTTRNGGAGLAQAV